MSGEISGGSAPAGESTGSSEGTSSEADSSPAETNVTQGDSGASDDEPGENESLDEFVERLAKKNKKPKREKEEKADSDEDEAESETDQEPDKPAKAEKRILKLKVDGEEIDFDISNEADLTARLQKSFTADRRLEKAGRIQKQSEAFVNALKANPFQVLSHPSLGLENLQDAAEQFVWNKIQREKMTPEERQAEENTSELERYRQADAQRAEAQRNQQIEQKRAMLREQMQAELIDALDKSGVPKNDWSVRRMANLMRSAMANGIEVTALDVANRVKAEYVENHRAMISQMTPEQIVDTFGKDAARKILDHEINKVESSSPYLKQQRSTQTKESSSSQPRRRFSSPYDLIGR